MSSDLLTDFPKMPSSVGGQQLPDFMKAKIIERNVKMPIGTMPPKFDFSIKKSDAFGTGTGEIFDEGATWFPLKLVHMTWTAHGASSYRALYAKGPTAIYGQVSDHHELKMSLARNEYVTGISGTYTDKLTSLNIVTTQIGVASGESFAFDVPEDHHVVGFHGRAGTYIYPLQEKYLADEQTISDDHIRALGVSYSRRLASISPLPHASISSRSAHLATRSAADNQPFIEPFSSSLYLDAPTQAQWAANDMSSIEQKRAQAQKDLQPIYDNISKNGESAWTLVEHDSQKYYVSWTASATMWAYVKDQPQDSSKSLAGQDPPTTKTSVISVGSYSKTSNLLGISGYIWKNIPVGLFLSH
ncbi:hypothetical protein EYR36_008117 [Pleurotus pulmonarius]|nr:hypothetical protein EYR36_008117 [Pleurotus pulmonarius]